MNCLILFFFLFLNLQALASPAEEKDYSDLNFLDDAKDFIIGSTNSAANRLDSFFATERADDELGRSRLRIRSRFEVRERSIPIQSNQYRFNLRLPYLEQKFKDKFFKKKNQNEDEAKEKLTTEEKIKKANQNDVNKNWVFNSDLGVSVAIPPKLVARTRARRSFETNKFIHRFVEQLTYITDASGLVEETSFDSDYSFNENLIFRFVNNKQWQILKKNFNTIHGPTLLHRVSDDDAFNYGVTMQSIIGELFIATGSS